MSTENKRKVLLGFGAFAVVVIAVLAIWRPPAFRSEDASGSIGAVQKHHAPQITQQDVILGDETTRHEQQIRYADFLNDAAKLHSLSAKVTANNIALASTEMAAMRTEVQQRYLAAAREALAAAKAQARESQNRAVESKIDELSAILGENPTESVSDKFEALSQRLAVKSAAERAQSARHEVDSALAEMRSNQASAAARMENATSELKAINAISLADRSDYLMGIDIESWALARDIEALGKMASRPMAENQVASLARPLDAAANDLENKGMMNMQSQLNLIIVVCSAVRDIDARLAEARGVAQASVAGRNQAYDNALANVSRVFSKTQGDFNAQATAGINAELSAVNAYIYFDRTAAGSRAPQVDSFLASLSAQLNGNTALASLAQRDDLAMRTQNMAHRENAHKNENKKTF